MSKEMLELVQTVIAFITVIVVPVVGLYVKAKIESSEARQGKQFDGFRLELANKLGEYNVRAAESTMTHAQFEKRITVVEGWYNAISERLDQLVLRLNHLPDVGEVDKLKADVTHVKGALSVLASIKPPHENCPLDKLRSH